MSDLTIVARADFQGDTLLELQERAVEAFFAFLNFTGTAEEFGAKWAVLVGEATRETAASFRKGDGTWVHPAPWKAECYLVEKEQAK